jgi:uncharacterized NAD(P)/FAD-binding protein YdhS
VELRARGHRGPVLAVSRRGMLPASHAASPAWIVDPAGWPPDAVGLLRRVRAEIALAATAGVPWTSVIDGLRPHTTAIWRAIPPVERRRLLRHARAYWEVHRHRAPADQLAVLDAWQRDGLTIAAGRVQRAWDDGERLRVAIRHREGGVRNASFDAVINATGAESDPRRSGDPLYASLLASGTVAADPLGLGLACAEDGAALDAAGARVPGVWVLGAARRPLLWESTAVPELSRHAAALAGTLASPGCVASP